jgi:hypothetical protein
VPELRSEHRSLQRVEPRVRPDLVVAVLVHAAVVAQLPQASGQPLVVRGH